MKTLVIAVLMLALATTAAFGATQPLWTPAKVVTRLKASTPIAPTDGGNAILKASCVGTFNIRVPGHYSHFACKVRYGGSFVYRETTLAVRIRPVGSGKFCVVSTLIAGNHYALTDSGPKRRARHGPQIKRERVCPS